MKKKNNHTGWFRVSKKSLISYSGYPPNLCNPLYVLGIKVLFREHMHYQYYYEVAWDNKIMCLYNQAKIWVYR